MQKQGMMMGPMKGHLAPNSSPFKPTINKLSSQYLIQDHMSSHYSKLTTAKPAIDNAPPRSMMTSVKKRDQMKREAMAKQMKLYDFEKNMKHTNPHNQHTGGQSIDMSRSFSVTVSKHGYDEVRPQTSSSLRSGRLSARSRPFSGTLSSASSTRSLSKENADILNRTYSGDYLDRHEKRFKNVDAPFTPRLKKRPGKSYLSSSKHYAPPLVLHKETRRKVAAKSPSSKSESDIGRSPDVGAYILDSAKYNDKVENATSSDEENREWTTDQSEILRRLTLDNTNGTMGDKIFMSGSKRDTYKPQPKLASEFFGTSSLGKTFASHEDHPYETKYRIHSEDDELKYLEFINAVTNDILTRGIYSDRVLTKVMERHLEENRGRLNEERMRLMLIKLQRDLGVSSSMAFVSQRSTHTEMRRSRSPTESAGRRTPTKKRSPRKTPQRTQPRMSSGTSGSEASDGGTMRQAKKGILKNRTGSRSGSDQDARSSNISSGEELEKPKGTRTFNDVDSVDPTTTLKEVAETGALPNDTVPKSKSSHSPRSNTSATSNASPVLSASESDKKTVLKKYSPIRDDDENEALPYSLTNGLDHPSDSQKLVRHDSGGDSDF